MRSPSSSWKTTGPWRVVAAAAVPQERQVDDRRTRAPWRGGRSAPARPWRRTRAAGCGPRRRCPARPRRCAAAATRSAPSARARSLVAAACSSWPTWRTSVSRRSPPTSRQHARGQALTSVIVSASDATPRRRSTRAQPCSVSWTRSQSASSAGGDPLGVPAEETGERDGVRAQRGATGAPAPPAARSHSRAASSPKTLPAPLTTAGTPRLLERVPDLARPEAVGGDEHGDVGGRDRAGPRSCAPEPSSADDVAPPRRRRRARAP